MSRKIIYIYVRVCVCVCVCVCFEKKVRKFITENQTGIHHPNLMVDLPTTHQYLQIKLLYKRGHELVYYPLS